MDTERFAALCRQEAFSPEGGIGTLGEKRLHALIKRYLEPRADCREVKLGRVVADICNESGVTEVQTGSYTALARKLPRLLAQYPVTVVCPVAAQKQLVWIDPATGELTAPRKSPKKGDFCDACYDLCRLGKLVAQPGLTVQILLIDLTEYRLQNGWGNGGKRGSARAERVPAALAGELVLRAPADWAALLPAGLPDPFTSTQLRQAMHRSPNLCAKLLSTLTAAGAISRCGKQKNSILYTKTPKETGLMKLSEMTYTRPDTDALLTALTTLTGQLEAAADPAAAGAVWQEYNRLRDDFETMATLASIRHTCDTRDRFYDGENDFFDQAGPLVADRCNRFSRAMLNSRHRPALEEKLGSLLFLKLALAADSSCEAIIPLMQEENALVSRYEKLYAGAQIEFDGKLCTVPQMALYKRSTDRAIRRAATQAEGRWFDENRAVLDEIFDRLVQNRTAQAKAMGYESYTPLSYLRMGRCGYGAKEVAACRDAVAQDLVPMICRLKAVQAKRIGLSRLALYDDAFRFADGNAAPTGTPEEILAAGQEMYRKLSPETAEYIDFMFQGGLFDVLSREGKAPGGYCTSIPNYKAPFIFSNFNATADDVDVLTHEAGHGFQMYLAARQNLPAELREPGMESCEIHSMSMEFLTSDFHHLFFGENTKKYQLAHAEDALCFLPYGCMVDEFQQLIYDDPTLTADGRNAVWAKLERKYRPWIDFESLPFYGRGAGWQRQLHIYECPFYYIDYCLAQLVALQFFNAFLANKADAWQRYLALTQLAGTKDYAGLVHAAGFETPFEPGAVQRVCRTVADWVEQNQL